MEFLRRGAYAIRVNSPRHLLVDGSNILHAWPELRALAKEDRDAARARLVQQLTAIHDAEQVRVTVVFDGRGEKLTVERPSDQVTFSVIYTPSSLTADDVIEQIVTGATEAVVCTVATDDLAERSMVIAAGGNAIAAAELAAWVRRAADRQEATVAKLRTNNLKEWRK